MMDMGGDGGNENEEEPYDSDNSHREYFSLGCSPFEKQHHKGVCGDGQRC